MATIGLHGPANFKHIVINNGAHDSVGGQPTNALDEKFDFLKIAQACGYKAVSFDVELSADYYCHSRRRYIYTIKGD